MKKFFNFAMLSAIALTGAMTFTACSSEDEVAEVNPTFDGEAVKTTFTISLPGKAKTRMSYETVQAKEDINSFRGMDNIVIVPYRNYDATNKTVTGVRLGENITLWYNTLTVPTATNEENAIPSGKLLANSNAVLYNDVTVPLLTSGFLFYGKATEATTDNYANGNLTVAGMDDDDEITARTFTPTPIVSTFDNAKGVALATYVSNIAAAKADDTKTWAACADPANHTTANQDWYNADLGDRYTAFTSLKPGASQYVQAAVQDLYTAIYASTNPVAVAIKAAIKDGTNAKDENNDGILEFQDIINGYPENNNSMPAGAVALTWSSATPKVATAVAESENNGMTVNTSTVVYPAALWYFANSALKVSNKSEKPVYVDTNDWNAILGQYVNGESVAASTRSVAIVDPIQYAVGRLDTKVNKLNATTKYYDHQGVEVDITHGFTFTGVLIGGQKAVNWKFEPSGSVPYTIYDKAINTSTNGSATLSASADAGTNYTLALETEKDEKIRVALEFVNDGDDFYGADGVVKKGCKFYMIAELDPSDSNTTGATNQASTGNKVFKQDFRTIANFSIATGDADADGDGWAENPAGFANAYVTIPDLRTPMLELGFSVDLHWENGITFDYTF